MRTFNRRPIRLSATTLLFGSLIAGSLINASNGVAAQTTLHCTKSTGVKRTQTPLTPPQKYVAAKTYIMTIVTNCGTIKATVDGKHAPITATSMIFLASKKYFDNTLCHRLTTSGIDVLQCGDPTGTGGGNPGYSFQDENLPTTIAKNRYPEGTIAMANSGANTNGSQFFLVYGNDTFDLPASYTIWGHITSGLDILKAVAAKGVVGGGKDGAPAQAITIKSLTIR